MTRRYPLWVSAALLLVAAANCRDTSEPDPVTTSSVRHTVFTRLEVDDTVQVQASDANGVAWIGVRVQRLSDGAVLVFDTVNVAAARRVSVTRDFPLRLDSFFRQDSEAMPVVVSGYACDLTPARNCAFSEGAAGAPPGGGPLAAAFAGGAQLAPDTVLVVSGITIPFPRRPLATQIADAIFNANLSELYLTNTTNNIVEVFQVANTSFVANGMPFVGPQPWGIALWPADTLGNYLNRIVVANSGGTQLAIMDAATRAPLWRQDLPQFLIETYKVIQVSGAFVEVITVHDLSDRPQYVATVCRPSSGVSTCHPDSVYALYSTSPTPSSSEPFPGRGTIRMEKLINTTDLNAKFGHFFWEISVEPNNATNDTLRIEMIRHDTDQYLQRVVLSACLGVAVELARMGLGDRTFARNSGNFTHAFFGEGGVIVGDFARVMSYDARDLLLAGPSTNTTCATGGGHTDVGDNDVDFGMSPALEVSDFISNTGTRVRSIATNFNGLTHAVRADSIYYIGEDLRLKSTSIIPDEEIAVGMDMNYFHDFAPTGPCPPCGGTGNKNNRILFAARPDGSIAVFDTYYGDFITAISVRDPIVGPLRVARDATGTIQYLFGVTGTGIVTIRIPAITNPAPVAPHSGSR
jgi:hypothetical protein